MAQSRLEQANGSRGINTFDDCVVPNEKARMAAMLRANGEAGSGARPGTANGNGGRRRDRQGGLRWLFNSLRTAESPTAAASIQVRRRG